MLKTIRSCSKDADLDAPDNLYIDAIKMIDSYLVRARDSRGNWSQGLVPFDHGAYPSDSVLFTVLSRRKSLVKKRVSAIEEAIKDEQGTPSITEADVESAKEIDGLSLTCLFNFWLSDVDVNERDFPTTGKKSQSLVPKFLNRLLGMSLPKQRLCKSIDCGLYCIIIANCTLTLHHFFPSSNRLLP